MFFPFSQRRPPVDLTGLTKGLLTRGNPSLLLRRLASQGKLGIQAAPGYQGSLPSLSRSSFLGECDPHQSLPLEGTTPTCPANKRVLPRKKQLRVSLGIHHVGAGEESGGDPSTHSWEALWRKAAWACASRWPRRLQRAGCLEGSWKCGLPFSFSSSSNLCLNASADNPKQEREIEP